MPRKCHLEEFDYREICRHNLECWDRDGLPPVTYGGQANAYEAAMLQAIINYIYESTADAEEAQPGD